MVIIHHTEQFKYMFGMPNYWEDATVQVMGKLGVVLFFVLSGFLISYLLFQESKITGSIAVRKFYIRRMLRVWPLYFLILILALFIWPEVHFFDIPGIDSGNIRDNLTVIILLYIFLLPQVVNMIGFIPYASQTWSIGCEEQFYLIWPLLNKWVKNKWKLMLWTIGIYVIIKYILILMPLSRFSLVFGNFWNATPFVCMAIGGLFAVIIFEDSAIAARLRRLIFSGIMQWTCLLAVIIFVALGIHLPHFHYEFYSILFGILITNLAMNQRRIFSIEIKWLSYLGKISYGIYMFHPLAIVASIKILQSAGITNYFIMMLMILSITIAISALSYTFFEKYFINMKIRYSKIVTGDNVQPKEKVH